MNSVFLNLLNMSIAATWTVLAVLLLRLLLRKAPKRIICLLWAIPALRLLIPVFWESGFSLLPSAQVIPTDISQAETPIIYSGLNEINSTVNPMLTQQADHLTLLLETAFIIWLIGVGILLLYSIISWLRLRFMVRASIAQSPGVYLCDEVKSPFIFGILRPRIYLPSGLDKITMDHVLAHEQAHLKRLDHLWKPLGYLLLSIYWFNPLLWVAYILLCRDIERACDEKVLADMDEEAKLQYAKALVDCSTHRRMILTCPIAFGEVGVVSRIKAVLSYKKPALWIVAVAFIAGAVTSVCFLTNPRSCQHSYRSQITLAATCTHPGKETFTCDLCGHSYMATLQPCTHNYDVPRVLQPSDCSNHGQEELTCRDCDFTIVMSLLLAADVHELHTVTVSEPTCTHPGEIKTYCARCNFAAYQPTAEAEHTFRQTQLVNPTCRKDGKQVMRCAHCGLEKVLELKATGAHVYKNGSSKCMICGHQDTNREEFFQGNSPGLMSDVVSTKPKIPQWPVIEWGASP